MKPYNKFKLACSIWAMLLSAIDIYFMYNDIANGLASCVVTSSFMLVLSFWLNASNELDGYKEDKLPSISYGYIFLKGIMVILNILYVLLYVYVKDLNADIRRKFAEDKDNTFKTICAFNLILIPIFLAGYIASIGKSASPESYDSRYIFLGFAIGLYLIYMLIYTFYDGTPRVSYIMLPIFIPLYFLFDTIYHVFIFANAITFGLVSVIYELMVSFFCLIFGIKRTNGKTKEIKKTVTNNKPTNHWR